MSVQILPGGRSYPQSIALRRGPQVLALEKSLNPGVPDMDRARPASLDPARLGFKAVSDKLPAGWKGAQAYAIDGADGQPLVLAPFADAREFRVWLPFESDPAKSSRPATPPSAGSSPPVP
jgi:hypothetical protein